MAPAQLLKLKGGPAPLGGLHQAPQGLQAVEDLDGKGEPNLWRIPGLTGRQMSPGTGLTVRPGVRPWG